MMQREFDSLSKQVIGLALEVHKQLGPGLLESTYEKCLGYELFSKGLQFETQKYMPVVYKGIEVDCGYRIDMLVEGKLIIELKVVDALNHLHEAQLLTYMKLAEIKVGLLINFNSKLLRSGIKRFVL
jgi:GxxExxY protein